MDHLPRTIAIDGPAASGKSALASRLADALGYFYFDSGLMYRAVTNQALRRGISIENEVEVTLLATTIEINVLPASDQRPCIVMVDGSDVSAELHRPEVDRNVSTVSAYPGVRKAMTEQQRRIAERGSIIMAGRDIGTVVLPDADCKIFLTASVDSRARRRMEDRLRHGQQVTLDQIREEILRRDAIDSSRSVAPLRPAQDAVHLDNSAMTIQETVQQAIAIIPRIRLCGKRMNDERIISLFHPFANWVLRVWYKIILELDMQGVESVPRTGPLLIVINHTHFLDPLIPTAYLRPDIYPMAKAEVFNGKWKWMFEGYGSFPVRRGEADMHAIKHAFRLLRAGHIVLMAPEGTRAKVGGLQRAHEGAGLIASRSNVPVLPIALWGGRALVPNVKSLHHTPVHMHIHPPLIVKPQEKKFSREEITTITDEIMYSLATMLPPEYRGAYSAVENFSPRFLAPYHAFAPATVANAEVIPMTN